ncbi:MAG: hypothetical protein KGR69_01590 [Verrucomicrobia bacterium]|nr:hypothetical protein [Verrucomicrobiota bacterium]
MTWLTAFAITQAVEVPVYLFAGRRLEAGRRWLLAFGASAVTHPVVWFAFPWQTGSWELCFISAETFAVVVEGALGLIAGIRNPWPWSLAANGASVCVGIAVQELGR